ncbi:rhodanese-like domain-containing protein [Mesoterricola sediminis]|uniref:Rhodanese domain-containing protein n=1 Tax=Mesoterricola sediminis TaxID=2927980 RepID=A0AA48GZ44_9BACT|nr:rhodanese-like domain-containing protein [Mesoterricola sediminis]BDU78295.1 hypothetical protein METESE_32530 [Mesoterricola sediminis]
MNPPVLIRRAAWLLAVAGLLAAVSNALAGPGRRLAWTGRVPVPAPAAPAGPTAAAPAADPAPAPIPAPRPAAPKASPEPGPRPFPPDPGAPVRDLTSGEAWEAYRAGIPFLDARRSADYAAGHVAGAWCIPVWEDGAAEAITRFEAQAAPDPKAPLVLYCSGGGCEDSHLLARRLLELGYRNLLVYGGGWPDWTAQGRPTARGGSR